MSDYEEGIPTEIDLCLFTSITVKKTLYRNRSRNLNDRNCIEVDTGVSAGILFMLSDTYYNIMSLSVAETNSLL